MTVTTASQTAHLLVELDRLGIAAALKGDRISLQPASLLPADVLAVAYDRKADLMALLADPHRRWREQAAAILADVDDAPLREDLQHLFDEREAIASVDGGLDDDQAGRLSYRELCAHLDYQRRRVSVERRNPIPAVGVSAGQAS